MLDPFYLIVDDAAWLERFLPLGLKLVQLRIKDQPEQVVRDHVRRAKILCEASGCTLVINDAWSIALDEGCSFVHLGQEDLQTADLLALKRADVRLGISTHDENELSHALRYDPAYVALGPIFPTVLKSMRWAPQGYAKLTAWRQTIGALPLVAIGGFTPDRALGAYEAGADCVCVVTDVLRAQDPAARFQDWFALTRRFTKPLARSVSRASLVTDQI